MIYSVADGEVIGSNPDDDRESSSATEDLPPDQAWIRRSFWVKTLQDARRRKTWVRVNRLYTEKTAAQVASDLRAAHHRDVERLRVKGILPGDKWDTRWNSSPEGPEGQYSIWIRYIGHEK
ncbi:MAG: hypothetical protein O3B91_09070 [Actinomycetota bacterium]|nr:hypothetical protein [Actinomycetota bacterium]MDA3020741.1 hypothetical protein [Actinomycetota bacterium]